MAYINYAQREIQLKIVFYGCGFCGKTTNLQALYQMLETTQKSDLVSIATGGDRTLFFDFMSLKTPTLRNFTVRFQLYTVPGQAMYSGTRQLVLRGADGVVFCVDSSWDRIPDNIEAWADLLKNLELNKINPAQIPIVIQYNKRDLPDAADLEYLEFVINNNETHYPSFEAVASTGYGVLETLNTIARMLMIKYSKPATTEPGNPQASSYAA
jgi:hypothetical protein